MWTRRAFLERSALALAASACAGAKAGKPAIGPLGRPIGVQLYSVREEVAKDLAGTLRKLASFGYREVEFAGVPAIPAAEVRTLLEDCGLTAPSTHAGMSGLQSGLQQQLDFAAAVGARYLVCASPWTEDARFRNASGGAGNALAAGITLDDWKWNAEQLNRIGELTNRHGIRCGYHNHNMEFRTYDGVVAYDELLRWTEPAMVTMEMDIGWVVTAGADPLHYLSKHAQRIALLHIKDIVKDATTALDRLDSQTTEVGSGQIDWPRLFAAAQAREIRHYFVEQENFERSPLEAAKMSYEYLHHLRLAQS